MTIIDTHVLIWLMLDPNKVKNKILERINQAKESNSLYICDISYWELGLLVGKGRLSLDRSLLDFLIIAEEFLKYRTIGINSSVAHHIANMPTEINRDPADRIITATCLAWSADLITADKNLHAYNGLRTLWE